MNDADKRDKIDGGTAILSKGQHAARQSVITLVCIGIAELLVAIFSGSIAVTADGIDSLADALISFIVWFGILMAKK